VHPAEQEEEQEEERVAGPAGCRQLDFEPPTAITPGRFSSFEPLIAAD
jgi:hypothetical protein